MNIPTITTDPIMSITCIILVVVISTIIAHIDNYAIKRMRRFEKDMTAGYLIRDIIKVAIYFVALLIILQFFGVNLGGTLLSLGIVGIAVSLAAKEILSDLFSGIILILGKSIKTGDSIEINNMKGIVKRITMLSTVVIDDLGHSIIVPNSALTNNTYIHFKPQEERRINIIAGLPLDIDIEEFSDYIIEKILSHDGIAQNPKPIVFARELTFEESKVKVSFWIKDYNTRDRYKLIIANDIRKYMHMEENNEQSISGRNIEIEK